MGNSSSSSDDFRRNYEDVIRLRNEARVNENTRMFLHNIDTHIYEECIDNLQALIMKDVAQSRRIEYSNRLRAKLRELNDTYVNRAPLVITESEYVKTVELISTEFSKVLSDLPQRVVMA